MGSTWAAATVVSSSVARSGAVTLYVPVWIFSSTVAAGSTLTVSISWPCVKVTVCSRDDKAGSGASATLTPTTPVVSGRTSTAKKKEEVQASGSWVKSPLMPQLRISPVLNVKPPEMDSLAVMMKTFVSICVLVISGVISTHGVVVAQKSVALSGAGERNSTPRNSLMVMAELSSRWRLVTTSWP